MNRRSFLKRSSVAALLAVGEWSGLTKVFAQSENDNGEGKVMANTEKKNDMEHREASARSIRRAHAVCPLSAVQSEYAIWWREPETKIFPTLEELGIGFVPYCPLGRAFLTGVINEDSRFKQGDRRWNLPQFTPDALKHNMPLVALVRKWAERKGITPAQFALVWMLSRKPWIAPIPGTTNPAHLDELMGAGTVRLSAWEMEEFDKEYARIDLMGHRADPFTESQIDK